MVRRILVLALAVALALAAVAPAAAKEGVQATLDSPAALRAAPGESIAVGWTLGGFDGGERYPFNAEGIFLRLLDAAGGEPVTVLAEQGPIGHYVAEASVPEGGLGGIVIGLLGRVERNGVSEPSEVYFPIVNDPFSEASSRASLPEWPIAGGAAAAVVLGLLVVRRLRPRRSLESGL